ncbi:MAG TPA: CHASE domain-containing protein [Sphingobacteriaceae bacterium]
MKLKSFIKSYFAALLIPITILCFTTYAWLEAFADYNLRTSRVFDQRSSRVAEIIANRMIDYAQILKGCQGLFNASGDVSAREWNTYVQSLNVLKNYPGIQGLAVSKYLPLKDSSLFLKELREIHPGLTITSSFDYPVITPVLFIEPLDKRNERALGFDLYSEVHRRAAIKRAIASKQPSITRKIVLRQETQTDVQPGFLMFLPIFSDAAHTQVNGFVANVFRSHDLMSTLLAHFKELDIQIYDGTQLTKENLIYDKLRPGSSDKRETSFRSDTTLMVAGLPWRLVVQANEHFGSSVERQQPYLILAIGVVLSILLFLLSYNNTRRKARIAEELEQSLALERKKDEFISIASHELKTPLTSIKATVQLVQRTGLRDMEKTLLLKAGKNIDKLQALISDLLDISKIQAGQLRLNKEQFKLSDLVYDSIESVSHIYLSHKIEVLNSIPDVSYYGDKFRLEQAINNLLINAMKYSPGAEKVYVDVNIRDHSIEINVIDHGIGIAKSDADKIFERFFRAEEISSVISGLGIGLHIASQIVKRHHGSIKVKSETNKGSVFTIILPLD